MKRLLKKIKSGFTLIELLAVIVILAVIALIVTPAITGIISHVRKASFKESCNAIVREAKYASQSYRLKDSNGSYLNFEYKDGEFKELDNKIKFEINGSAFDYGHIYVDLNGNVSFYVCKKDECASKIFLGGVDDINFFSKDNKDDYIINFQPGNVIILNDGSYWHVISKSDGKVRLVSDYSMKVDGDKWIQNRDLSEGAKYSVPFDLNGRRTPDNGNSYCTSGNGCSMYASNGTTVNLDSSIKETAANFLNSYVNSYVVESDSEARLISKDELVGLGCIVGAGDTPGNCTNAPTYIRNSAYWTMTARNNVNTTDVWFVDNADLTYDCADRTSGKTFKPVIEMPEITFYAIKGNQRNSKVTNINSVWMWENNGDYDLIKHPENIESTLSDLSSKGINTIYLAMVDGNLTDYKYFIATANKLNMDVYYLTGDPGFIADSSWNTTIYNKMSEIVAFNSAFAGEASISGIHYDVEFYGFADNDLYGEGKWIEGNGEEAKKQKRRLDYIRFVREATAYARKCQLKVDYDVTPYTNMFDFYDTDNTEKNMLTEILKVSDSISLMTYGNGTKNTLYPVLYKGNYTFPDSSSCNVEQDILEKVSNSNSKMEIGQDLEIIYNTANEIADNPQNGIDYLPEYQNPDTGKTDYLFTPTFVKRVEEETAAKVDDEINKNNYNITYGFAFHDYRYLMKLLNIQS